MTEQEFVYFRIAMALVSAQRVEYVAKNITIHLSEFDKDIYGVTTREFLNKVAKGDKLGRMTLGQIFTLLKLNPKLVVEDELNEYLAKRNILVHGFFENYLNTYSPEQVKKALDFCYKFGRMSDKVESFFKGFYYFLVLRHVKDRDHVPDEFKKWDKDFDFFIGCKEGHE